MRDGCARLCRRAERILGDAQNMDDLGPCLTGDLTGAELRYLSSMNGRRPPRTCCGGEAKLGLKATPMKRIAINQFIVSLPSRRLRSRPDGRHG